MASSQVVFTVKRQKPILVAPAKPTPYEFKPLSDIDDQGSLRFQIPIIQFYRNNESMRGRDPASVVQEALANALVLYYPFAGRLRQRPNGKLVVECTREGVLFVEADAQVRLEQLGHALQLPFPCFDELLYDVPGTGDVLNCPLLLIQVTRLACGGFILALRLNHTMSDAAGLVQFMNAMGEMAQGALSPRIAPVWCREVLNARNPPRITCVHHEYNQVPHMPNNSLPDMAHRSFFFSPHDISLIRAHIPPQIRCSTFDLLTACLWRCRTISLCLEPNEEVKVHCIINARGHHDPPLPHGYYGNAFAFPGAISQVGKLCKSPLGYAVKLVKEVKDVMTKEYIQSVADVMVLKGRPPFAVDDMRNFLVSDVTRAGFQDVDFGLGKAVYGGPAKGGPGALCFYVPFKDGVMVLLCLPKPAMERFSVELQNFISSGRKTLAASCELITSAL